MEKITVLRTMIYAKSKSAGDRKVKPTTRFIDWTGFESITDKNAVQAIVLGKVMQDKDLRDIRPTALPNKFITMLRDTDGQLYMPAYSSLL